MEKMRSWPGVPTRWPVDEHLEINFDTVREKIRGAGAGGLARAEEVGEGGGACVWVQYDLVDG
jgi:hypothetical protein